MSIIIEPDEICPYHVLESPTLWFTCTATNKTLELKEDTMTTDTKTPDTTFVMPDNVDIDSQDELRAYFSSDKRSDMDNIRELTLLKIEFPHNSYRGIIFCNSRFKSTPITGNRFSYCNFEETTFVDSPITAGRFNFCDFDDASLCGEIIKDTQFFMCNFRDANFAGCTFDNVRFSNCNFDGANLNNVKYLNHDRHIPFSNCDMNTDTKVDMRTFQIAGYLAAECYEDKVWIGCSNHTIDKWIANGEEIGKNNDWPDTVIASYMDFVKSFPKPEGVTEPVSEPTKERYFVCSTEVDGSLSNPHILIMGNKYFNSFLEAFTYWSSIVQEFPTATYTFFELRDGDKILFTTRK